MERGQAHKAAALCLNEKGHPFCQQGSGASTRAHTHISQQHGRAAILPNNSCCSEPSPSPCKAFLSDRFVHVPFVILQPFCSGILNFIFNLNVGLIVVLFRCSPFCRGHSVIHSKRTPDPWLPFCSY